MEPIVYSKADALKMMIDGELMKPVDFHNTYFKWCANEFKQFRINSNNPFHSKTSLVSEEWIKYIPKPNLKVGDRVKCERWGRGKVTDIREFNEADPHYMVTVYFSRPDRIYHFSTEGYYDPNNDETYKITLDKDYLGTTVDGVDIYEGYEGALYHVNKHYWEVRTTDGIDKSYDFGANNNTTGFFSTKQLAQEWVNANKPKEIVGTTLDGVEIEKGKYLTLWAVTKGGRVFECYADWHKEDFTGDENPHLVHGFQRFSTREAAEAWKKENLVGITEDDWHVWKGEVRVLYYIDYFYSELKETHPTNAWGYGNILHFKSTENNSNYFKSKEAAQAHLDEYLELRRRNAGNYVVLLSEYEGSSNFAKNYVFKMKGRVAKGEFNVQFDCSRQSNGMGCSAAIAARTRLATSDEVKAYELSGKPIHINEVEEILKPKVRFEVGDDVIHPGYGEGIVTRIVSDLYSIRVEFNRNYTYFTEQGKFNNSDVAPTLTFKPGTKPFKVGQKVRCLVLGEGRVTAVSASAEFVVRVRFSPKKSESYTSDGRWRPDFKPTLFHIVD